jgi:hypothetical protein
MRFSVDWIESSETRLYHFEWTSSGEAGLLWLFGDHLGSTSVIANGVLNE